ncbi:PAS domain S-box protein [Magnetofaba australis]|uniref:histidine kinase n=1 Tax=Magnetofaba australis IT-1 TaxID=1434232 RepID=A0A1Y2K6Q3_9PROT|nr:PAS domain S-box protein [Magnetofaba australis]OSM04987.1 putative multi-sensor hybrid histidine kinase [Magnetofaba australis IT-1]
MRFEERYHALRQKFARSLPDRLQELTDLRQRMASAQGDAAAWDLFFTSSHGLIGAAATFSFPDFTERARSLANVTQGGVKRYAEPEALASALSVIDEHLSNLDQLAREAISALRDPMPHLAQEERHRGAERRVVALTQDEVLRERLRQELARRNAVVESAPDYPALHRMVESDPPDGVLLDMRGLAITAQTPALTFSANYQQRQTPSPVAALHEEDGLTHRLAAVRLGSTHFFRAPGEPARLARILAPLPRNIEDDPYRVLLVDDSPVLTEFYQSILEQAGMQAHILNDPSQLLEALDAHAPELVVLDLYMPGINGIELGWVIRQNDRFADLPLLFLSGEKNLGRRLSDRNLAHEDYLIKPVSPAAFTRVVLSRIKQRRDSRRKLEHMRSALRELEHLQHALNEHAIVSVTDPSGRITYANEKFCETSGYTMAELIGQDHRILKSGEHPPEYYARMWETISNGQVWHGEVKNRRKDGSFYWVSASIVPLLNDQGEPWEYISIRTDITQQRMYRARAHSMALFAEKHPSPMLRVDCHNLILDANPAAEALGMGQNQACPFTARLAERGMGSLLECVLSNRRPQFETTLGDRRYNVVLQGVSALSVAHIYAEDITDRVRAEETLREREARISAIVEHSNEGMVVVDAQGAITLFNRAAETLFGCDAEQMMGRAITDLLPQSPFPMALPVDVERLEQNRLELSGVRIDGGEFEARLSLSMIPLSEPAMFVGIVQDISARKQFERNLTAAKEAAERASQAKSRFLSSMSHELRTPMNAVLGFSQLLLSDPVEPLSAGQADSVQEILSAGNHLLELINEVLDLARIESGRIELKIERTRLGLLLQECLTLMSAQAAERGVLMPDESALNDCAPVFCLADRKRLKQVALNLLSNAIKYNIPGGEVMLGCDMREDGFVRVWVRDTGRGIPAHKAQEVFEPFNRLGADHSGVEGSGIGLAICRRLMEEMGGAIGFESEAGKGALFWIDIPLSGDAAQSSEEGGAEMCGVEPDSAQPAHAALVLYVEDDPINRKLMERAAARRPAWRLITAPDAESGLAMAKQERPHLCLLDINLPGKDGFYLLEALRADRRFRTIPIYAVTASAMPEDVARGRAAGFDGYITKPLQLESLLRVLDAALERRENALKGFSGLTETGGRG